MNEIVKRKVYTFIGDEVCRSSDLIHLCKTYREEEKEGIILECNSSDHDYATPSGTYFVYSSDMTFLLNVMSWSSWRSGDEFYDHEEKLMVTPDDIEYHSICHDIQYGYRNRITLS